MADKKIEIVASYTDTIPGKMIKFRAAMKFWNRYAGDTYSHISLSRDSKLGNMMSLARKEMDNPFNSGFIKEDIRTGMFALKPDVSKIAVMELKITEEQYNKLSSLMDYYWVHRDDYSFNYLGLASMLFCGRGVAPKNSFFCSQWVATVLQDSGINIFDGKNPKNIRPFDFYGALKDHIIYEGLTTQYPEYSEKENYDISPGVMDSSSLQKVKKIDLPTPIISKKVKV
ncbi:MAG TPA: hypothetical protein IAB35_04535 [Candidatus Faecimonas gallistercoris]|nr:hypothetical protein [Candidatus Faecimonas gallistercoris]